MQRITARVCITGLLALATALAQDGMGSVSQDPQNQVQPAQPLTVADKFHLHLVRCIDVPDLAGVAFGTVIDQALMIPYSWGGGGAGLGRRLASNWGENAVEQQLQFGVEALDGEDPRLPEVHAHGFWRRATSAALTTFYRRSDRGGNMIAWSEFVGAYGSAYISHQWWPRPFNDFHNGFVAGTDSVGMDVGMNVMREFMPDIKHALHLGHRQDP